MDKDDASHNLVQSLYKLQKKSPKLVRSSVYDAPEDPETKIRSWKMSEQHYYKVPSPFPTLARGIFTRWVSKGNTKEEGDEWGHFRIVARGYDKFFNIGEVPWTTWDAISKHTQPPYTLSVKSNGCIIFIAALTPEKLIITSKHSIGAIQGQAQSHSQVGDAWLSKHLEKAGKTRAELAKVLFDNRWTAVAELCDDSFEEHVLAYSPENTGLHLHGINRSTAAFETLPSSSSKDNVVTVKSFATEWGFIPTKSFDLSTAKEVKEFTDKCSLTGSWNGEPIEGFVVRSHIRSDAQTVHNVDPNTQHSDRRPGSVRSDAPPYPPGASFFFKVKFDEPYMMYRDWREITKSTLSAFSKDGQVALRTSKASKQRLKRAETRLYDEWVRNKIKEAPELFESYQSNKGIVRTRQIFLDWLASPDGTGRLAKEKEGRALSPSAGQGEQNKPRNHQGRGKAIIVPIAIPGCGKTALAVALSELFGFGHTQSDDVIAKSRKTKTAAIFEANVKDLLQNDKFQVVIADKNNHLRQHREALRRLLPNEEPPIRLIALYWPILETTRVKMHQICAERIARRGTNHQTLRSSGTLEDVHEEVLWKFIETSDELQADEVEDVIEMDVSEDLETALRRVIPELCKLLNLAKPSEESIRSALEASNEYAVPSERKRAIKGPAGKVVTAKKKAVPRYFGIIPRKLNAWDIKGIVNNALRSVSDERVFDEVRKMWKDMCDQGRLILHPHVTLVHQASLKLGNERDAQVLWDACLAAEDSLEVDFALSHLVYNDRTIALTLVPDSLRDITQAKRSSIMKVISPELRQRLHITVGMASVEVNPVEAGHMVLQWRQGKLDRGGAIPLLTRGLPMGGKVEGLWS